MRLLLAALALAGVAATQNQGLVLANGAVGYVDVPYSPTLVPTGGITVEAWVTYNSALPSGWRFPTIVRMDPTPNTGSYFLRVEAGQTQSNILKWWVATTNGIFQVNWFFTAGALANWTHVAATYDGTTLRIFANGAQVAQGAGSGTLLNTNGVLRVGSGDLTVAGGETWNGEIDELRVWPFARSAAAIASTMNEELVAIPGEVSTWNLNGSAVDTSGGNHGTAVGTAAFASNTLVLTSPLPGSLIAFGYGSGCHVDARMAANSLPALGNGAFTFVGTHAPASPVGVMLLGTAALPVPVPLLGVDVFVDFTTGVLATVLPTVLHEGEVPLAIPNTPGLVGAGVLAQCAWFDAACVSGFSASDALVATIVP